MSTERVIRFTKAPDYQVHTATGVWGGVAPQGDIFFDLFIDRNASPEAVIVEIRDAQVHEKERKGGGDIVRELQMGVLLRADIAYSIGKWLMEKAEEAGHTPQTTERLETQGKHNG